MRILTIFLCLFLTTIGYAQDGTLDESFGVHGVNKILGNYPLYPNVIRQQSTGKIVVVGTKYGDTIMRLMRLNANGSTDINFGVQGSMIINFNSNCNPNAMMIQNDDKIVIAGISYRNTGEGAFSVFRFTSEGLIDRSFNGNGAHIVDFMLGNNVNSAANSIALQPDGKILVTGKVESSLALIRLNQNGDLDTSFNRTGIIIKKINASDANNGVRVMVKEDKRIIVMTRSITDALVQFNSNGSLDTLFGNKGVVSLKNNQSVFTTLKNGNIIFAESYFKLDTALSSVATNGSYLKISRFLPNGQIDTLYGLKGSIERHISGFLYNLLGIFELKDSKVIVGGAVNPIRSTYFSTLRFNQNGSIDTTFGQKGESIVWGGDYWYYEKYKHMSLQNDEKILVCSEFSDYAYIRFFRINNSNTTTVDKPIEKNSPLSIFPNPMNDLLFIDFKNPIKKPIKFTITNMNGQQIYQYDYTEKSINNIVQLTLNHVQTGLYVLKITTDNETISRLISKQ